MHCPFLHVFIQTTTKSTPIYFNQHSIFRLVHNLQHLLPFLIANSYNANNYQRPTNPSSPSPCFWSINDIILLLLISFKFIFSIDWSLLERRMSLPCLTCRKLQRCNSDREPLAPLRQRPSSAAHWNWSGCLVWVPPASHGQRHGDNAVQFRELAVPSRRPLQKLASASAVEIESEASTACNGPQLRRSSGMRRDWSFENLNKNVIVVSLW